MTAALLLIDGISPAAAIDAAGGTGGGGISIESTNELPPKPHDNESVNGEQLATMFMSAPRYVIVYEL